VCDVKPLVVLARLAIITACPAAACDPPRPIIHAEPTATASASSVVPAPTASSSAHVTKSAKERLLYRLDKVDAVEKCEDKAATHVFVGVDANDNGSLEKQEAQPEPMTFCTFEAADIKLVESPPNAYCPRPGRVLEIRFKDFAPDRRSELVVCFTPSDDAIESTYAIYTPR
jgi:hypothetical protein